MNQEELFTIPFFSNERVFPEHGEILIAEVGSYTDEVVHCVLPMYGRIRAILPTRHMNIRRGKKVKDYVKVGDILVATVYEIHSIGKRTEDEHDITEQEIDLSIKSIKEMDQALAKTIYHRAIKVHQIVCSAAQFNKAKVLEYYELLRNTKGVLVDTSEPKDIWADVENDMYAYFQEILVGKREVPNREIYESIVKRMDMPSYTVEKDIRLNTIDPNGVKVITDRLNAYVSKEGTKVYIVAPPVYKVTATGRTKEEAEAILATL
jgi:translation initiation factor 2 alpha subunit (eIF-2alpha)